MNRNTMQAVVLHKYDLESPELTVEERPMPQPGPNQVLVKIAASPTNPSDVAFVHGLYGFKKPLPTVPGFEASGTVVAAGSGLLPRMWMGRRVVCTPQGNDDGTWAEYARASALQCLPLGKAMSLEQGSMMLVNPLTTWALIGIARRKQARAIVQTAAGSALGQMIWRLGQWAGIDVINVVRRAEQAEELRRAGMAHVLSSSDPEFESNLKALCQELKARLGFDAVGGELAGQVLRAMPSHSRLTVYGGLSLQEIKLGVDQLIFQDKTLDGFWLSTWVKERGPLRLILAWRQVLKHANRELKTEIRACYPLSRANDAIAAYMQQMSGGKILFTPDKKDIDG